MLSEVVGLVGFTKMFEPGCNKLLVIVNVRNRRCDRRIDHIDRALDVWSALGMTAVLVLET